VPGQLDVPERPRRSALELQVAATRFGQYALECRDIMITIRQALGVVSRMLGVPVVMLVRPADGDRAEVIEATGAGREAGEELIFPAALLTVAEEAGGRLVIGDWLAGARLPQPPASRRLGVRSSLLVILPHAGRPCVLLTEDYSPRVFRNAELDAVTAVAGLLAAAVARHRQETAHAAVAAFGQFALESRSAAAILQRAVDLATEILDAPIGFVARIPGPAAATAVIAGPEAVAAAAAGGVLAAGPAHAEVLYGRGPLDEPFDGELEVPPHLLDALRAPGPLLTDWPWPVTGGGPGAPGLRRGTPGISVGVPAAGRFYRLGVAGTEAGRFPAPEADALQSIARLMAVALERDRADALLRATSKDLQRALLPAALPSVEGLEAVARYVPAGHGEAGENSTGAAAGPGSRGRDRVGGDWYDVLPLPQGGVGLVMGDVEGHDGGAAAVMGQVRNVLRAYAAEGHPPAEVLTRVNRFVAAHTELLVTCCYAELHPQDLTVSCVTAGHPVPWALDRDGTGWSLPAKPFLPLGVDPEENYREHTSVLSPGCCLLLVTDGLVGEAGAIHPGDAAFRARAGALAREPLECLADALVALPPGGPGPRDDAALLAVRLISGTSPGTAPDREAVQRVFTPSPSATPAARRFVADLLTRWGMASLADGAALAVSELVTNAVMHTTSSVRLTLRRWPAGIWIGVHDTSDRLPVLPRPGGELEPGGRGLTIVDRIADCWGVTATPEPGGKTVWLELSLPGSDSCRDLAG
jgi:serine phosphatase RsbU (regulator of sigma subunit)/anti-sigma regulatory factor (Ser/Thr protein kinase)